MSDQWEYKIDEVQLAAHCIMLISGGMAEIRAAERDMSDSLVAVIATCTLIGDFVFDSETGKRIESDVHVTRLLEAGEVMFATELAKFSMKLEDCPEVTKMLFAKTLEVILK